MTCRGGSPEGRVKLKGRASRAELKETLPQALLYSCRLDSYRSKCEHRSVGEMRPNEKSSFETEEAGSGASGGEEEEESR